MRKKKYNWFDNHQPRHFVLVGEYKHRKYGKTCRRKNSKPLSPPVVTRQSQDPVQLAIDQYAKSERWATTTNIYVSKWPYCACLICNSPRFVLHHVWLYRHQNEWFEDLIPLCLRHQSEYQEAHRTLGIREDHVRSILRDHFKFSDERIQSRLKRYDALPDGPINPERVGEPLWIGQMAWEVERNMPDYEDSEP